MSRKAHIRNILIILIIAIGGGFWYLSTPDVAKLDIAKMQGQTPDVSKIRRENFPTIQIADVVGWKKGELPTAATGLKVTPFAADLKHPRNMLVLPNGDVLVAESNAPERDAQGIGDWIAKNLILKANAGGKSADRITLLRDTDGDGLAETRHVLLEGLKSPYGMALVKDQLYVANTNAVRVYPYALGQTKINDPGKDVVPLPDQAPNNHWTRNLLHDPKGNRLYVTVGSNSNIGENGMESEEHRAQIKELDLAKGRSSVFAYGLRNPTGLAFNPDTGTLWTSVNERDMLGSDGPPDYMTSVTFGTFYGWPYFYWGQEEDRRVKQERMDLKQYSKRPDYALGPHVAALGMTFNTGAALGDPFAKGAFVALHGSWNRKPKSGYKVVFIPFTAQGFPAKDVKPIPVLTGFLSKDEDKAFGRPAAVAIDSKGALLVADDSGNMIWRVTKG